MRRILFMLVVVCAVALMAATKQELSVQERHEPEMAPPPCAEVVEMPTDANCQAYNQLVGLPVPKEYRVSD